MQVALVQSCFREGPGLVAARDFVAGEAVITVTGPFLSMQAALAYDCKAVLSLNFRRENSEKLAAKKCSPVTSKSLLHYVHYLDGDAPGIDDGSDGDTGTGQVVALSPVIIQSPYREPVLRLEAQEDIKAFQGELAVKLVLAAAKRHSSAGRCLGSSLRRSSSSRGTVLLGAGLSRGPMLPSGEDALEEEEQNTEEKQVVQTGSGSRRSAD
ncbi:unnamed protein product [Symbiodinium sp. CCMP2592]|nr:unnamed protein product [Symbiodinium sp. CCMP2592]